MKEYNHRTIICKARPRSERLKTGSRAAKSAPVLPIEKERLAGIINIISRPEGLIERIGNNETAIAAGIEQIGAIKDTTGKHEVKINSLEAIKARIPLLNEEGTDFEKPALKELLRGPRGERGLQGDKGEQGATGKDGKYPVPTFADGRLGFRWSDDSGSPIEPIKVIPTKGVDYFDGAKGDKGDKGDTGAQGPQGIQGLQGAKGTDGKTWKPTVATDGSLSWTLDTTTTVPAAVNIRGPQGLRGATGATGAKGDKGDKGDTGAQGKSSMTGISVGAGFQKAEVGSDFYAGMFDYDLAFRNDVPIPINGTHVKITYKGNSNPSTGANGGSNVSITGYDGALKKIVTLTGNSQVWHYLSQTVTLPSSVKYLGFTIATKNWTAVNTPELLENFIEKLTLVMTLDDGTVIDSDFWKFMNENVFNKHVTRIVSRGAGYLISDKEAKEAYQNPRVSVNTLIKKYGTKLILNSNLYAYDLDQDSGIQVELHAQKNVILYGATGWGTTKTISSGYRATISRTAVISNSICSEKFNCGVSLVKCT